MIQDGALSPGTNTGANQNCHPVFFFRFQEKIVLYRTVNTVPNLKVKNYTRLQALRALFPSILFLQPKLTKTHNFHHEWPPLFVSLHEKELIWNYYFEYQLMAHFCYIKWIFNPWNSQGRDVRGTDGRTFESTMLCLVGREQDANVFMSFDANINPNILQNCTIRLLVCSLKKATPIRGSNSGKGNRYLFSKIAQVGSGAHPASHSMGTGVHPQGVKRPGRAADH